MNENNNIIIINLISYYVVNNYFFCRFFLLFYFFPHFFQARFLAFSSSSLSQSSSDDDGDGERRTECVGGVGGREAAAEVEATAAEVGRPKQKGRPEAVVVATAVEVEGRAARSPDTNGGTEGVATADGFLTGRKAESLGLKWRASGRETWGG